MHQHDRQKAVLVTNDASVTLWVLTPSMKPCKVVIYAWRKNCSGSRRPLYFWLIHSNSWSVKISPVIYGNQSGSDTVMKESVFAYILSRRYNSIESLNSAGAWMSVVVTVLPSRVSVVPTANEPEH